MTYQDFLAAKLARVHETGVTVTDTVTGEKLPVQFNPEEYTLNREINYAQTAIPGLSSPLLQFVNGNLQTLEMDVQGSAVRDARKRVQSLTALVHQTRHGWKAGPDEDSLIADRANPWDASATALLTGQSEVNLSAACTPGGQVFVRHDQPLPFTLLGIIPKMELGG